MDDDKLKQLSRDISISLVPHHAAIAKGQQDQAIIQDLIDTRERNRKLSRELENAQRRIGELQVMIWQDRCQ